MGGVYIWSTFITMFISYCVGLSNKNNETDTITKPMDDFPCHISTQIHQSKSYDLMLANWKKVIGFLWVMSALYF